MNDLASALSTIDLVIAATVAARRKDHEHGPADIVAGGAAIIRTLWLFRIAGTAIISN